MDREQLCFVLEACLLAYEGCDLMEIRNYGINEELTKAGIKLSEYLKTIKIKEKCHVIS